MAFDQGRNMLWTWKSAWNKTRTILVANESLSSGLIWYTRNRMHTLIVKVYSTEWNKKMIIDGELNVDVVAYPEV
jgi:hypothetical protein